MLILIPATLLKVFSHCKTFLVESYCATFIHDLVFLPSSFQHTFLFCKFSTFHFNMMWVFLFWFCLLGALCAFYTWMGPSNPRFGKFSASIVFNMFSMLLVGRSSPPSMAIIVDLIFSWYLKDLMCSVYVFEKCTSVLNEMCRFFHCLQPWTLFPPLSSFCQWSILMCVLFNVSHCSFPVFLIDFFFFSKFFSSSSFFACACLCGMCIFTFVGVCVRAHSSTHACSEV